MTPVWILSGPAPDWSAYTAELLRLAGLVNCRIVSQAEWIKMEMPPLVVVMGSEAPDSERLVESYRAFVRQGGWLVLFAPPEALAGLTGLSPAGQEEGPWQLLERVPLLPDLPGTPLQVPAPIRLYNRQQGRELAWLIRPDQSVSWPGLVEYRLGKGGVLTFAYHLPACVTRLRQGNPARREAYRRYDSVPRPLNLFEDDISVAAAWYPQADLHARLLAECIATPVERRHPLPRLWHLPGSARSLILFSGDEDGASFAQTSEELSAVRAAGGTGTIYCMNNTPLSPAQVQKLEARGHALSAHPDCTGRIQEGTDAILQQAKEEVHTISRRLNRPIRTVRNHCLCWPDYLVMAELWESLGIRMDTNYVTGFAFWNDAWAPYMSGSGLPLRFCREDGRLIDVFQQPTHLEDDVVLHPYFPWSHCWSTGLALNIMQRVVNESLAAYHQPLALNIHPTNYVSYSGGWTRRFLHWLEGVEVPVWSMEQWLDFWQAREQTACPDLSWENPLLTLGIGPLLHPQIRWLIPLSYQGLNLQQVSCQGKPLTTAKLRHNGRSWSLIDPPDPYQPATIQVLYG